LPLALPGHHSVDRSCLIVRFTPLRIGLVLHAGIGDNRSQAAGRSGLITGKRGGRGEKGQPLGAAKKRKGSSGRKPSEGVQPRKPFEFEGSSCRLRAANSHRGNWLNTRGRSPHHSSDKPPASKPISPALQVEELGRQRWTTGTGFVLHRSVGGWSGFVRGTCWLARPDRDQHRNFALAVSSSPTPPPWPDLATSRGKLLEGMASAGSPCFTIVFRTACAGRHGSSCAGVSLLTVVGERHGIETHHGISSEQHNSGVLPG